MPQIMIDTSTESAEAIARISLFLRDIALNHPSVTDSGRAHLAGILGIGAASDPDAEIPAGTLKSVVPPAPSADDPAKLFGNNVPAGTPAPVVPIPPAPIAEVATGPAVSSASTTTPTIPAVEAPRDTNGALWNPDLHSTPAKLNATGEWRARRGLTKNPTVPLPPQTAGALVPPAVTAVASVVSAPVPPAPTVPLPPVPQPPAAGGPAPVLPPANADDVKTFPQFMKAITGLLQQKTLNQETINLICQKHGITSVGDLIPNAMLIPRMWADIRTACGIV